MKKPEKKEIHKGFTQFASVNTIESRGYNKACNNWEKFLPSEEEIKEIIVKITWLAAGQNYPSIKYYNEIAKAIAERIGRKLK